MPKKTTLLTLPADRPVQSKLVFFALGALTTVSFAPFGMSLLLPLILLPFLYVCLTISPRDAAGHAFWFGVGLFLSGTYWIYISVVVYGNAPPWVALLLMLGLVLIMSIYLWATGWLISRLASGEPWYLLAVAPTAWVLVEWLRGCAPVLGVYGVSAMLVFSAAAVLVAILTPPPQRFIAIALVLLPWIGGGILKSTEWTEPSGPAIRSTLIQAGISQDQKWKREQLAPTLQFYRDETQRARDSALVVWPEVAIPALSDRVEGYVETLESVSRHNAQTILYGILERDVDRGQDRIFNSVVLVDDDRRQVYRKRHLVPFGEYFPVPAKVREWMRMMSLPYSDLAAGDAEQPLLVTADGTKLGVAICYEDAYGAEQLYALPDAGLLVNVSNDAWFGDSIAPHQHLQIARMRSLEVGRATIRATNTGISAFIAYDGGLLEAGAQFEPVTMTRELEPRRGATPYVVGGNRPIVIACLLLLVGFWLRTRAS